MNSFNFQQFHFRSINAKSLDERIAINQELKALYASLSAEQQQTFNQELERYITSEKSKYQSVMKQTEE